MTRSIAPMAIIGGTFSVYSSAMKVSHKNSDLTPLSILYLLLLALNYAIMPRLSRRFIHPKTNKRSVALAEELVKMTLGLGGWVMSSYVATSDLESTTSTTMPYSTTTISILSDQLQNWSPTSTLLAAGIPSSLYALQAILTYNAYQHLDPVTYNSMTQLKTLSSALCCYILLQKKQSYIQVISLGLLMVSTIVFQGSWKHYNWFGFLQRREDSLIDGKENKSTARTISTNANNNSLLLGVFPCFLATLLSGLAGAFSQKSLQTQVGSMYRNAYFYTIEISFLSAVCLMFSMGMDWLRGQSTHAVDFKRKDDITTHATNATPFFEHWTCATLLPITTKATAGLLTALVHRNLGSVIKGFALVLGLVFSALLQFVLDGDDLSIGS